MEVVDRSEKNFNALKGFARDVIDFMKAKTEEVGLSDDPTASAISPAGLVCKCYELKTGIVQIDAGVLPMNGFGVSCAKSEVSAALRTAAKMLDADAVLWASESIRWTIDEKAVKASGMTLDEFRSEWPSWCYKKRTGLATPLETITVMVDSKYGRALISQPFTRDGSKPVWGEISETIPGGDGPTEISGQFAEFLEKRKPSENAS
jgi:hypothetical protein